MNNTCYQDKNKNYCDCHGVCTACNNKQSVPVYPVHIDPENNILKSNGCYKGIFPIYKFDNIKHGKKNKL